MSAGCTGAAEAPLRLVTAIPESRPLASVDDTRELISRGALTESSIGTVGLELEFHVVDLAVPARRVAWDRLVGLVAELAPMPCGSAVTLEPGGQVELSTLPTTEITSAVAALDADRRALSAAFTTEQLALVALGADPARPPERMSPKGRYAAMEQHFLATGSANPGAAMMCSTAALQVNINAGPAERWSTRVSRLHQLGPILVAISACSPYLAGRTTGWKSMRQQAWGEIDQARCGPLLGGPHPEDEWASYALLAPVMLVNDPVTSEVSPITTRVSFEDWVSGAADLGRPATAADLDYHLSTLFPPVRLRGFLEVRCIDAVPQKWWPGLAGIAATLMDDPIAGDRAAEICAPLTDAWTIAARDGLHHPSLHRAARDCVELAVDRAPLLLRPQMTAYAELVESGRTPGDEVAARCEADGPLAALEALAREVDVDA